MSGRSIAWPGMSGQTTMRTANYIFAVTSVVLGVALILFMFTQTTGWNIGTAIGIVLVLNGVVRLWFARDDK